jgi:hypothetical protein
METIKVVTVTDDFSPLCHCRTSEGVSTSSVAVAMRHTAVEEADEDPP